MLRIALAVSLVASSVAAAMPPGMVEPMPPPPAPVAAPAPAGVASYREQTALADGLALLLLYTAVESYDGEGAGKLGLATYFLGAPIVHIAHGRYDTALASVTLRVGLPILGGMIGGALHKDPCAGTTNYDLCDDDGFPSGEAVVGILAGALAASLLDTGYFARADEAKAAPTWGPTARASATGFSLGVAGSF